MDYRKMTADQLDAINHQALIRGNLNASVEIGDFREMYMQRVRVIRGRKVPAGTEGVVFWVKRYDNSKYGDPWGIYSTTKIGFKDDDGNAHFTAISNVEIITEVDCEVRT